jgi:pimeloyl-ACP methyl ester carboxylesterase
MTGTGVPAASDITYEQVDLRVGGVDLTVTAAGRDGGLTTVVFLHGFGSTKEDYLDIACQRAFAGHPFLAYDAPGCGETFCEDLPGISIPFLVATAQAMLDHAGIRRFHLVGHSMGGLTALLLAHQEPDRVLSFVDIEGSLAPGRLLPEPADFHPSLGRRRLPRGFRRTGPPFVLLLERPVRGGPAPQGTSRRGARNLPVDGRPGRPR